jgi:hypothetical protein
MIVSYSHRFIFIKARKVAGTSVEVFLSQFCDEDDIVTTLGGDEVLRPGHEARNFRKPGRRRGPRLLRLFGEMIGRPSLGYRGFYPHMPACEVRRLVGEETWNSFFKFTIERNPWDRQVSLYHWHYRNRPKKPSFDLFIRSPFHRKVSRNFDTYAIEGKVAADQVCRYETLTEDLAVVLDRIGLKASIELPRAKGSFRGERPWRQYYTPRTRDIVGRWYAREIAAFGYTFSDTEPSPARAFAGRCETSSVPHGR